MRCIRPHAVRRSDQKKCDVAAPDRLAFQEQACARHHGFEQRMKRRVAAKAVHLSQMDPVHDSIIYALGLAKGTLTVERPAAFASRAKSGAL